MKLFNSLTNKKEEFVPRIEGKVSMYLCGPTVYNHAHVGNVRPLVVFDVLRKVFEYRGLEVVFASNYTDVDDKIIKGAKNEGMDDLSFSSKYIKAYEDVREKLNVNKPTYTPKVSETMDEIIDFIEALVEKKAAYQEGGDVYFDVSKVEDYGSISKIKVEDLIEGASERVDENDKKHSSLDFALWKETSEGIAWDSPWSKGRPGWHSECVVMIKDIFGSEEIDIHGGGQDLKFPHHENEVAQSMAMYGHHLARFWVHNQMLNINNQKMSKSLGNFMLAKDVIEELGANVLRWLVLSSHYRNPLNYTDEVVDNVKKEVNKVENVIKQVSLLLQIKEYDLSNKVYDATKVDRMVLALEDDLNSSLALTLILDEIKTMNQLIRAIKKDDHLLLSEFNTLLKMLDILGFDFKYHVLDAEEIDLYQKWNELKLEKKFDEADKLRNQLIERGII